MNLEPVSFGGSSLNTASYVSYMLGNEGNQPDGNALLVNRAGTTPLFVYKDRQERLLGLQVELLGQIAPRLEDLRTVFDTYDSAPRRLIVKDSDDSNKQWYVDGVVTKQTLQGRLATVILSIPDPIWKSVATSTVTWTATSSPWEEVVFNQGNREAYPVFTLQGTIAKGAVDFQYSRFVHLYSRANVGGGALPNYPLDITNGGWATTTLIADAVSKIVIRESASISASQTVLQFGASTGVIGNTNMPLFGMALITSGSAAGNIEQITYTSRVLNPVACLTGVTRGVNGTTAQIAACGASIQFSKMQADGDDIRVFVNDVEVPRWITGMNTSATRVWVTKDWPIPRILSTAASISAASAFDNFELKRNSTNLTMLKAMPKAGTIIMEREVFAYKDKDTLVDGKGNATYLNIRGVTRGIQGTTAAAHGAGLDIFEIGQKVEILYGSSSISSPIQKDQNKPAFDLANSENKRWDFQEFKATGAACGGAWISSITRSRGGSSTNYGGSRSAVSAIASRMGIGIRSFVIGNVWQAEDANLGWTLTVPPGVWKVDATGEKQKSTASGAWPGQAILAYTDPLKGTGGVIWNESDPTNAATWYTWTRTACVIPASAAIIGFGVNGTITGGTNKETNFEIERATLYLWEDKTPFISFGSETGVIYSLAATLTNLTAGSSSLAVAQAILLGQNIEADSNNKTVRYSLDGSSVLGAIRLSNTRTQWLALLPGSNTIRTSEDGLAGLRIDIAWQNRKI